MIVSLLLVDIFMLCFLRAALLDVVWLERWMAYNEALGGSAMVRMLHGVGFSLGGRG